MDFLTNFLLAFICHCLNIYWCWMNVIHELDAMNTLCALKAPCLLSFCFLDFSIVLSRTCFELGEMLGYYIS